MIYRRWLFIFILFFCIWLCLVMAHWAMPIAWLAGAQIFLLPTVFLYAAMRFPLGGALCLALVTGLLYDAVMLPGVAVEGFPKYGWSTLPFIGLALAGQGVRSLFLKGRWEVHTLISGGGTFLFLLLEFATITWMRGSLAFDPVVLIRCLASAGIALFFAPLFYFAMTFLRRLLKVASRPPERTYYASDRSVGSWG
ncbi:MAG: hypothetical protein ACFCU3_05635 [Verrucomicrobiales bacterium]